MGARRKCIRIFLAVCLLAATAVVVYAYLSTNSQTVTNSFEAATDPQPSIKENFDEKVKTNVAVSVKDLDYAVYVRAVIVVTWKNEAGNVYAIAPVEGEGKDYEITINSTDWFMYDGFYYHYDQVTTLTAVLIKSCKLLDTAKVPEGYSLSVEIIAQTIQALGTTDAEEGKDSEPAVEDAWGIKIGEDRKLVNPNAETS